METSKQKQYYSSPPTRISIWTFLRDAACGGSARRGCLNEHQTDLILLDFSKAFDCVPHQRLLLKLHYYGISGPTLYWVKSFLSNRTQHVSINGSHSALANVTSGVSQGSVIGPVLFLLSINDITNQIQSNIRLFADDSIVYRDHHILQTDIQKLTDWSNKWQMNFNTSKCHLLTITHKPKPSEFNCTISNQPISRVNSHPYLDEKLSWIKHIQSTASKSAKTLGLLKRTLYPAKPKVKEAAYNMLVRPKLEYGAIGWNPHTQNNINTLEKIHRSAARFVVHDHRRTTSVTHIQSKLGWQTLETRRLQHQFVFLCKIKYNLLNISLPQHLIVPCTRTRNSDPNKFVQIPTRINYLCILILSKSHKSLELTTEWNNKTPIHRHLPSGQGHFQTCSTSPSQSFVNIIYVNMKCYVRTFLFKVLLEMFTSMSRSAPKACTRSQ